MAITSKLKRVVDRKQWEMLPIAPAAAGTGTTVVHDSLIPTKIWYITSTGATGINYYDATQDAFVGGSAFQSPLTNTNTQAAIHHPFGPSGTVISGTVSSIRTNLPFAQDLSGYKVRILTGPASGEESTITYSVIGSSTLVSATSGTLLVDPPFSVAPSSNSTYLLMTGRLFVLAAATGTNNFRYYDTATDTWSNQLGTTNADPANWTATNQGAIPRTQSPWKTFITSGATGGDISSISTSTCTWATNQFRDQQVRIVSGTGKGQFRTILSNTTSSLVVTPNWTIAPDNTSTYVVEGNDAFFYMVKMNTTTLYRYNIFNNNWTRIGTGLDIVPTAARAAAPNIPTAEWICNSTDSDWTNQSDILNGRYIYSLRGNTTNIIERYDIANRTWQIVPYIFNGETFTGGSYIVYDNKDTIYIQKEATGRFFKFNVYKYFLGPFSVLQYPGTAVNFNPGVTIDYTDGETLTWLYTFAPNTSVPFRVLVF